MNATMENATSGPVRVEMTLRSPLACEPGHTSPAYDEVASDCRAVDVVPGESTEAVSLMAGDSDVRPAEGQSWADLLASVPVHVRKGQYITVICRNLASPARRLGARVVVEQSATAPSRVAPRTREPLAPSPAVRFLVERGYLTYLAAFVENASPIPFTIRGALGSSLGSRHAVLAEGAPAPSRGSAVVVEMPGALRSAIEYAVRTQAPLELHPSDRDVALEALAVAATARETGPATAVDAAVPAGDPPVLGDGRGVVPPSPPSAGVVRYVDAATGERRIRDEEGRSWCLLSERTDMEFVKNTILQLEKRVADLEAIVLHRNDDAPANPNQLSLSPIVAPPAPVAEAGIAERPDCC